MRALRSPAISERASVESSLPEAVAEAAHAHQRRHAHGHRQHHKAEFARRGVQIPPADGRGPPPTQRALSHGAPAPAGTSPRTASCLRQSCRRAARSCGLRGWQLQGRASPAPASSLPCGCAPSKRSSTRRPLAESRLPVGSSAITMGGSTTKARASATRCCSPPESCTG